MAKLENVKVITVKAAEVIEVAGVKYEEVSRTAAVGDIVKITDSDADGETYITNYGFYVVNEVDSADDPHITDNDGDDFDLCAWTYVVYGRIEEAKTAEPVIQWDGKSYRKLTRDPVDGDLAVITANTNHHGFEIGEVAKVVRLDFDNIDRLEYLDGRDWWNVRRTEYVVVEEIVEAVVAVPASPDEMLTYDNAQYRKVDRPFREGDVIKITKPYGSWFTKDRVYPVTKDYRGNIGVTADDGDWIYGFMSSYDVYEKVAVVTPAQSITLPSDYVILDGVVYRKESRKAETGEKVVTIAHPDHGWPDGVIATPYANYDGQFRSDTKTTLNGGCAGQNSQYLNEGRDYAVLVAAETITIDGVDYAIEKRKAAEGETVLCVVSREDRYSAGDIGKAMDNFPPVTVTWRKGYTHAIKTANYVVLKPIEVALTEVKRYANVGERIKIVDAFKSSSHYCNGDVREVVRTGPSGRAYIETTPGSDYVVFEREYVVLETVKDAKESVQPEPKKAAVGDYAKVTGNSNSHNYVIGSVVKFVELYVGPVFAFNAERVNGSTGNVLRVSDTVPATEAEFKAQLVVTRLQVGEYAKVINGNPSGRQLAGDIVKIITDDRSSIPFAATHLDGRDGGWAYETSLVLATREEVAEAKRKLVKTGDYVRITGNQCNWPVGTIVKVTNADVSSTGERGGTIRATNGVETYISDLYEPLSPDEAEEARKMNEEATAKRAEEAKWSAIGRKVGEYKVNDIVRVLSKGSSCLSVGDVGVVTVSQCDILRVSVRGETSGNWLASENVSLITPAEQRFDSASAANAA